MKQLLFVAGLTLVGTLGNFVYSPFCGVAVYYAFAVLRPQYIWEWSLPPGVQWSRYVALATIAAAVAAKFGLVGDAGVPPSRAGRSRALVFLYAAWLLVTYFTARNREVADPYVFEYFKIFAMMAASFALVRTVRQLWVLLIVAALSLGYIAFEVNSLYFSIGAIRIAREGYGGLDNNGAGLMIAMGLPLCLFVWDGVTRRWRWGFLALVPIIMHASMMTYSRGAMLSMLLTTPLMLLRTRHRKQVLGLGLAFGILAVPILAGPEIQNRFFTISEHDKDESAQSRMGSWTAAIRMAQDYPIFGVGVRNANLFSHQYGADMEGRTIHSQYLQIAADNGFVGLALYLSMLGSVLLDLRRVRRLASARGGDEGRMAHAVAAGTACSLVTFCIGGAFLSLETFELPFLLLLLGSRLAELTADWPASGPIPISDE